jgi:RNA-directed DNA polymerase
MQAQRLANGTEKPTDWNDVNWRKANRTVRNLRQRIFRAAQEGNQKKVHSLQKLMVKSYSNRLVSVRRVTQINAGKDTPGVDKLVLKTPAARGRMVDALAHYELWKAKPARRVYIVRFVPLKRLMKSGKGVRSATDLNNFISKEVRKSNLLPLPLR